MLLLAALNRAQFLLCDSRYDNYFNLFSYTNNIPTDRCKRRLLGLVVVVVVYFILSRLLYLAFSANLGLLCMPHPGMGPLV